jgi:hypothetical protein
MHFQSVSFYISQTFASVLIICILYPEDVCSCQYSAVNELYTDPKERVICIPDDDWLPYEIPGFSNYKQHGLAQNDEQEKYAESNLHSNLSCVLKRKVRNSHK